MKLWKLWERFLVWGVLVLAAGLRIFQLGKRDFWYDEAFTGNMIRNDWSTMMKEIVHDVHPPLHYLLLKLYASVFGDGVVSLRFFSTMCGVLSVWLVYLLAKEWFGKRAGLYAGFIAAIAPFAIHYSQETRMYGLYGLLILFATYCFTRAVKTRANGWWVGWGVGFGLACLTHYMSFLFGPCFYAAWVFTRVDLEMMRRGRFMMRLRSTRALLPSKGFLLGGLAAVLVFLPWASIFWKQLEASDGISNWKTPARFVDMFRDVQIFVFGTPKGERSLWAFDPNIIGEIAPETLTLLLVAAFALFMETLFKKDRRKVLVVSTFFIGPLALAFGLSSFEKYYFLSRYVLPSAFFLYILVGAWLQRLSFLRAGMVLALYVLAIFSIRSPLNSEGYNAFFVHLPEYRANHFYSLNTFDYVLAKYYLTPERVTLYNTNWPWYDSRAWPGVGPSTKRTEDVNEVKNDPTGIVIWNTLFPIDQRDDHNFDTREFERIATYKNIELYRPRKFVKP